MTRLSRVFAESWKISSVWWCRSTVTRSLEESSCTILWVRQPQGKESWVITGHLNGIRDFLEKPAWMHQVQTAVSPGRECITEKPTPRICSGLSNSLCTQLQCPLVSLWWSPFSGSAPWQRKQNQKKVLGNVFIRCFVDPASRPIPFLLFLLWKKTFKEMFWEGVEGSHFACSCHYLQSLTLPGLFDFWGKKKCKSALSSCLCLYSFCVSLLLSCAFLLVSSLSFSSVSSLSFSGWFVIAQLSLP